MHTFTISLRVPIFLFLIHLAIHSWSTGRLAHHLHREEWITRTTSIISLCVLDIMKDSVSILILPTRGFTFLLSIFIFQTKTVWLGPFGPTGAVILNWQLTTGIARSQPSNLIIFITVLLYIYNVTPLRVPGSEPLSPERENLKITYLVCKRRELRRRSKQGKAGVLYPICRTILIRRRRLPGLKDLDAFQSNHSSITRKMNRFDAQKEKFLLEKIPQLENKLNKKLGK